MKEIRRGFEGKLQKIRSQTAEKLKANCRKFEANCRKSMGDLK
jgi:hypothetical protein